MIWAKMHGIAVWLLPRTQISHKAQVSNAALPQATSVIPIGNEGHQPGSSKAHLVRVNS